jgi:hypothetical protein
MTAMADRKLHDELKRRVESVLRKYAPLNERLTVTYILEEDDWYHVVVTSDKEQRGNEYYDALSDAEKELESSDPDHHFLLVPVIGVAFGSLRS